MNKKVLVSFILGMITFSLIILTGCSNEKELTKNEFEDKSKNYKEDAVISVVSYGGECTEDFQYYIFYGSNKIIEHEKFTLYPMTTQEDAKPIEPKYTVREYKASSDQMKEIKKIIESSKDKNQNAGTTMSYKVKIDDQEYDIDNQKRIREILNEIKGKE